VSQHDWPTQRLGSCYNVRDERAGSLADELPLMSVSQIHGVIPRSELVGDSGRAEDLGKYKVALAGDIVLNRMSAYNGALGVARQNGIVSPDYLVMTPSPLADPEFVAAWLKTPLGVSEMARRLRGIGSAEAKQVRTPRVNESDLRLIPIALPPIAEQRAIADYLDRETARIDTLIEEQRRLIEMLRERRESVVDSTLAHHGLKISSELEAYDGMLPDGWRLILLGRTLQQLTNGFVGPTRDILVDAGIRYIQSTHIKSGRIDFERRPFYVSREWHEQRPRIHLRQGDVLIVQTGDIGKVAVVPADFGESSCHALQIARVRPELLSGEYLGAFLSSRIGYQSLLARATGAMHPHLEAGIRSAPIVVPPLEIQTQIVNEVTCETAKIDALIAETETFIELSRERRSALITAAVTGQIDVRGAA